MATAMGEVTVKPGEAAGRLGEDAAAAEAAAAAAAAVSPDTKPAEKPAEVPAEKPAEKPAELTPEQKAEAVTAAEKAVTEAKTPEERAAAEAKLKELKGEGAPEKYEPFKMPEGVPLDEAAVAEFTPLAKELNLSQEQAQKLVDLEAKRVAARAESAVEQWNAHMDTTLAAAKADKEVGGQNWDQSLSQAKAFIKAFGTPALQTYLDTAEAGSHVEIIRAFAKAGKAVSEDGFVPGKAAAEAPKSLAERMYPNHK